MNSIALTRTPSVTHAVTGVSSPTIEYFVEEEDRVSHPALRQFDFLWRSSAQGGQVPGRRHFDPARIQELMPHLMLVDVVAQDARRRFRVRMAGHHHVAVVGDNPAGRYIDEGAGSVELGYASAAVLHDVVEAAAPLYLHHRVQFSRDRFLDAEGAIYPLADDGERIERLIAVIGPHYPRSNFVQRLRSWL